jgi:hypothetical protein
MPPIPFNRAEAQSARRIVEKLFPDAEIRRFVLDVLSGSLDVAHQAGATNWGVTLHKNALKFNVGRGAALGFATGRVEVVFDNRVLGSKARQTLQNEADYKAPGRLKTAPHAASIAFEAAKIGQLWPLLENAHHQFVQEAAHGFQSRAPQSPTWRDAHSPGVLSYLRGELEREIPDPAYFVPPQPETITSELVFDAQKMLSGAMASRGLCFPDSHLAAFFTALSSKGFVILSGPSGTGKTALALAFTNLLPRPGEDAPALQLNAEMVQNGQLPLPGTATRYLQLPQHGEIRPATIICDGAAHTCKIVGENGAARLQLRGAARRFLAQNADEAFGLESEWDAEAPYPTFRLLRRAKVAAQKSNHLFLPVRPDWRDEKPLLGYANPLANRYEWTPFLRFLVAADARFRAGDGSAHFVVFDEMNLARVEWYFADLLSVLEAGRDENGRAREPLRFDFDPRSTGELPPRELFLPPNLYFVGTINADETAQPLSPKVLDRAWVLEAPPIDFCNYPPVPSDFSIPDAHKHQFLEIFTRSGQFAVADKTLVTSQLEKFPARRDDLTNLNRALENHGVGFGFRVFDEILTFCAVARQNGLWENENSAFDAAIALKIAPRLRGSRAQIEKPLQALLSWSEARNLEQTRRAATRMLAQLERDGFLA